MHPSCKIIWIDAHLDCNSPSCSPSGNMHGMPLGYLCGYVPEHPKCMDMTDVCYLGIRSFEEQEMNIATESDCLIIPSSECTTANIDKVVD